MFSNATNNFFQLTTKTVAKLVYIYDICKFLAKNIVVLVYFLCKITFFVLGVSTCLVLIFKKCAHYLVNSKKCSTFVADFRL